MTQDQQQNDPQGSNAAEPRKTVAPYEYALVAVGSLIPYIGPLLFALTVFDGLVRRRRGFGYLIFLSFVGVGLGIYLIMTLPNINMTPRAKESETKTNVRQIQTALERYWMDHCVYPNEIGTLITEGYMAGFPTNAFTKQPMKEIAFGSSPYQGDFTYVRFMIDDNVRAFTLLAYGKNGGKGLDMDEDGVDDHVIIVLYSGCDCDCIGPHDLRNAPLPSLKVLLKAQKDSPQVQPNDGQKSPGGE